ncbi:MAG: hypothetical protein ACJ798_03840 [Phenylobacterium sp.]
MNRLLLAALAVIAAPAASAAQLPAGCFFIRDVGGRSVIDEHTLYFSVMDKSRMKALAYFRVTVDVCPVIPGSNSRSAGAGLFGVTTQEKFAGASAHVCKPEELKIVAGTTCKVERLERMTPEEVAAIPRNLKP